MMAVSVIGSELSGGKKAGTTVANVTVTVDVICELRIQPPWPGGGGAGAHVTLTVVGVRLAAARTAVIRMMAGPLSNCGLLIGSAPVPGVTTAVRAPSRAALVITFAVNQARLNSRPPRKMSRSVGKTTMNSSVEVPR
jgi:hypothetical protein